MYVAQGDIEAYFFRLGVPEAIGRNFCLPAVTGAVVAACRGQSFEEVIGRGKWFPYFRV